MWYHQILLVNNAHDQGTLFGQVCNLRGIPWVLKQDQVMGIETNGSCVFVLVKHILYQVQYTEILMLAAFGKQITDHLVCLIHQVINADQGFLFAFQCFQYPFYKFHIR